MAASNPETKIWETAQRNVLLRIALGYRTVALVARQLITGITPNDLMVQEIAFTY